jgi:hypothetical protein
MRLHQLDPVAEGIIDIDPVIAGQRLVPPGGNATFGESRNKAGEIIDEERRMRLARRPEIRLDAEMDPDRAALEPAAAALPESVRLLHLGEIEKAAIEAPRLIFAAGRHGELDVVELKQRHVTIPVLRSPPI